MHLAGMLLAWCGVVPAGVLVKGYFKQVPFEWHLGLMVSGTGLGLVAVVWAFVNIGAFY